MATGAFDLATQCAITRWFAERCSNSGLMAALEILGRAGLPVPHRKGMDITWLTDRIAVGGGIWTSDNMADVARTGVTHIIDMQIEFDDTPLGVEHGVKVLWNPTDDDFEPKPAALFRRGVQFAQAALDEPGSKVFIHIVRRVCTGRRGWLWQF